MNLWSFVLSGLGLGFLGSLHCLGMCGPLLLSLPQSGAKPMLVFWRKLVYHLSRTWVYGMMGLMVGILGQGLQNVLPDHFQSWISILSGLVLLGGFFFLPHFKGGQMGRVLLRNLGELSRNPSWPSEMVMGMLNALLPCGMVYVALSMALGSGSVLGAMLTMLSFGLGTTPALLGLSVFGNVVQSKLSFAFKKVKTFAVIVCSLLLIVRGLGLGIPYISPAWSSNHASTSQVEAGMTPSCCAAPK